MIFTFVYFKNVYARIMQIIYASNIFMFFASDDCNQSFVYPIMPNKQNVCALFLDPNGIFSPAGHKNGVRAQRGKRT